MVIELDSGDPATIVKAWLGISYIRSTFLLEKKPFLFRKKQNFSRLLKVKNSKFKRRKKLSSKREHEKMFACIYENTANTILCILRSAVYVLKYLILVHYEDGYCSSL